MKKIYLLLASLIVTVGCEFVISNADSDMNAKDFGEIRVADDFNYETSMEVELIFPENHKSHYARLFQVTDTDSIDLGIYSLDKESIYLEVNTNTQKIFSVPTSLSGVGNYEFTITNTPVETSNSIAYKAVGNYYTIGEWDNLGVPEYLESESDIVSEELLLNIDASLPESRPVPTYSPEYLNGKDMNTVLIDNADVWVTFVHEGAGYRNVLGYFTYKQGNEPASINDVDSLKIIYPNVSYKYSGGGLSTGDKVYLGRFEEGTILSWFLMPNAWNSKDQTINSVSGIKYAINNFNNYTDTEYRQHTLVLNNEAEEILLLSFEDITRPGGDNDFNDAIFYVSANPYSAIETADLIPSKVASDTDKDGVYDHQDDFPSDPERAYSSYWPSKNSYATILFEDQWPSIGDYDFNDLVADYNFTFVKSATGGVKELKISTVVKAVGGLKKSSLLFNLGVDQSLVESVSGNKLEYNFIKLNANGTETGLSDAVIPIFDNSRSILAPPAGYSVTNVFNNEPHVEHVTITTRIIFTTPIDENSINKYDPFIITEFNRGIEIHLPGQQPTSKIDKSLFGTMDDASNFDLGFTYKNSDGLPWALHVMESIQYPEENSDFSKAYVNFSNWAESGDVTHTDWFQQTSANMNSSYFYNKK